MLTIDQNLININKSTQQIVKRYCRIHLSIFINPWLIMSQVSHFPADIAQHFPINLWLTSNKNIPRESKAPLNKFEIVQLCSDIFSALF